MTPRPFILRARAWFILSLALMLWGCAGNTPYHEGMDMFSMGQQEEGLAKLAQASREAPQDQVILLAYRHARERLTNRYLGEALALQNGGKLDEAEARYKRVLEFYPDSREALAGLNGITQVREQRRLLDEAKALMAMERLTEAGERIDQVLGENPTLVEARALRNQLDARLSSLQAMGPTLRQSFRKPVTLEFRDAELRQVLEALSRHTGLNFVLDKDVPTSLPITVFLRDTTVMDALELILNTNQLRQRVLNESSVLIYPDTAAKQGEHQELVVRNFFLVNAEAKNVAGMLKAVLKAKNVFADDKLNLLMMRDTPSMVRLAERLVATQDVAEPEVMLEVAILEVSRTRLTELGVNLPNSLTLTPLASGSTLTLRDLQNLNAGSTGVSIASLILNLQDGGDSTNLLANPRIRTHNREKALIRIGDRVPVITTTATATGFVSENVQYVDVGLKLEVEPVIYPNDEIVIKMALEVSSVVKEIVSQAGSVSYQIGGRNASTVLRLKDGETQILGGLINDEDRRTASGVAGLNQLPILGRLFSNEKDNKVKSELLLSITPRIMRSLVPPAQVPREFWSGTENEPRLKGASSLDGEQSGPPPSLPLQPGAKSAVPPLLLPGQVPDPFDDNGGNVLEPVPAPVAPAASATQVAPPSSGGSP